MIINADVRDVLPQLPDEFIDVLVTDYPYQKISGGNNAPGRPTGILASNDGRIFGNNDISVGEWMPEAFRVLKPQAHAYVMTDETNRRRTEDAMLAAGFKIHQLLTWRKNNATPNRWYMKNYEFTFFGRKGNAKTINNPGSMACHDFKNTTDRDHPTEKPVDLMSFYVENSANPGDVVLDPFAGAGSTGVAALAHGCQFIGIEIDSKYAAIAAARLEKLDMTTPVREMLRDMLVAAGEKRAIEALKTAYEAARRPVIMGDIMPVPGSVHDQLWAAQRALEVMDRHTRRWETQRAVDFALICERDGKKR